MLSNPDLDTSRTGSADLVRVDTPSEYDLGTRLGGSNKGMRHALTCLMALLLAACACSAVGCGGDLRFGAEMLSVWAGAQEFSLEVCVEGDCETLQVGDALGSAYIGMPLDPEVSGSADVEVTVTTDTGSRTATGTIDLDSYRPNGGLYAPVCRGADVAIDGDTLRNAEPGEVPPRD